MRHNFAMMIDRESPLPMYHQLKELLVKRILDQEWKPGDMLPTEEQLQKEYALSRITVRRSLRELELDGKISRFRGKGTFVSKPKFKHSPEPHLSLSDYLIEQGMQPGWKVLSAQKVPAPEDVANNLQIEVGMQVYQLQRLRLANDEPIGVHNAYVSPKYNEAIDESALEEGGSLRYLRSFAHLEESIAKRILEAVPASAGTAKYLGIGKGSPVLKIQRLVISQDGDPIEDFLGIYRGDQFQYHIRNLPAVNPINA